MGFLEGLFPPVPGRSVSSPLWASPVPGGCISHLPVSQLLSLPIFSLPFVLPSSCLSLLRLLTAPVLSTQCPSSLFSVIMNLLRRTLCLFQHYFMPFLEFLKHIWRFCLTQKQVEENPPNILQLNAFKMFLLLLLWRKI